MPSKRLVIGIIALALSVSALLLGQEQEPRIQQLGGGSAVEAPPPEGPVPRLPDGTVDLQGLWQNGGPTQDMERQGGLKPGTIEALMLPWAKEVFRKRTPREDPHAQCMPMGVPRQAGGYPWRWVQSPAYGKATHLFMLYEANIHSYRQIFMDGRKHPPEEDRDPTWFGHSIGWWEGDTLVIDTVGFNDRFWFDSRGHPHSDKLHTIERWTRKSLGRMTNEVTIDDPGTYTKPFTLTFEAQLRPNEDLLEYICQENNQAFR
jgi:hypothetical protein